MPEALRLAMSPRNAAADAAADLLDDGTIEFRTGTRPTNVGDSDVGDVLATASFGDPAFGSANDGVKTANAIATVEATDSGECRHVRHKTSGGAIHSDAGAGNDSSFPYNFDNPNVVEGGDVVISSMTWTQPE